LADNEEATALTVGKETRVKALIGNWQAHRAAEAEPGRYLILAKDLYEVRNATGTTGYPAHLIDPDEEIMAAVEHYFLCRGLVGNAVQPAWEMRVLKGIYNTGKLLRITPRHNRAKPVTPLTKMQVAFQDRGIADGQADLKAAGLKAPKIAKPLKY
jgi:hypothetical protein